MMIFGFLPVLSFYFIYRFIRGHSSLFGPWRRAAFLQAAVIWGVFIVIGTELLSLIHAIQFVQVFFYWLFITVLFLILGIPAKLELYQARGCWQQLVLLEKFILISLAAFGALVGLVAFLGCPNSWDALTYHLSRVMFWKQNHSIENYPTPEFRQLFFPPWGEFAALHFQVLIQSDRFATLISWFCYVGSAVGVSLIGALCGANRRQQLLMALSVVTIPTAIIEASGVRLDMIVSFWVVILIAMIVLFIRDGNWVYIVGAGLSLGLGTLTKGTMYLIAVPLMFWFLYEIYRKFHWQKTLLAMIVIFCLILGLNSGFYWRNYQLTGDFLGPAAMRHLGLTEHMTPLLVVSNVIKDIFYQLGTPINSLNAAIESLVKSLHHWLNVDPLDPRSNYNNVPFITSVSTYEERVTNCLQVLLILAGGAVLLVQAFRLKRYETVRMFLAISIAFIYISSSIKWDYHSCRYLLPTMVAALPLVLMWIRSDSRWTRSVLWVLVMSMVITAIPYVLKNNMRRMIGEKNKQTIFRTPRTERYFQNGPNLLLPYNQAIDNVIKQGCYDVGLHMGFNNWDYPLWVIMQQKAKSEFRLEHIHTIEESPARYPLGDFYPCAIIAFDYHEGRIDFGPDYFVKANDYGRMAVYTGPKEGKQKVVPLRF